jgi:hypothetical protein
MRASCLAAVTLLLSVFACGGAPSDEESDDALASVTALQRKLSFEGVFVVKPGTSDDDVQNQAHSQVKSAFGALRTAGMMAQTREMDNLNAATITKKDIVMVDPASGNAAGEPMTEVHYTYSDDVIVERKLGSKTSYALALLRPDWPTDYEQTAKDCVEADHEAQEDSRDGYLWYYFNPSLQKCKRAIVAEQATIDADKRRVTGANQIPKSQAMRRYTPITVSLETPDGNRGATYPEYDKLFTGGVEPNKLVIGYLFGRLEHEHVEASKDGNYWEWLSALDIIFQRNPEFKLASIDPPEDITTVTANGKTYNHLTIQDYINWTVYNTFPDGMTKAQQEALALEGGKKLDMHWVTFRKDVKVKIGDAAAKPFSIEIKNFFGVEEELDVYKKMMKTSDVFVYNGHSYLGSGPLDPSNFQKTDFPSSYQLWFIDGCISYNYYNNDYFPLKGGSAKLDLIVNGLEADADYGGKAEAQLLARLISGTQPSFKQLLQSARITDPMRVVEGESDNKFSPTKTKITITNR